MQPKRAAYRSAAAPIMSAANPPCACRLHAALVGAAATLLVADAAEADERVTELARAVVAVDVAEPVAVEAPEVVAVEAVEAEEPVAVDLAVAEAEPEALDWEATVFLDSTTNCGV